ncbi:MAG: hypothetical protein R8G66_31270 [Cytophagales bacterium]|nr:hypothetical protein [Cytophagales bacterium]
MNRILILLVLLTSCNVNKMVDQGKFRVIPIQMSRITFIEHYKQSFGFSEDPQSTDPERVKELVGKLIGESNIKTLEGDQVKFINEDGVNGEVSVEGIVTAQIGLYADLKNFYVDGTGVFNVIWKPEPNAESVILFRADFYFLPNKIALSELKKGMVKVDFRKYLINQYAPIADELSYDYDEPISVDLYFKKLENMEVYHLDYERTAGHPVYIRNEAIGQITFDKPSIGWDEYITSRYIDLRGLNSIRDDYDQ